MVLLDLFSGVGGFHAGIERAGFNIRKSFYSEIEKHPINIYRHKFKDATYVGSVTTFREWEQLPGWERPNIVTFGSPCQDFSLAGKRRGMAGERSSLVEYAIDIISEWRPDFFIWENVKGVFSSNDGADFWAVIQAFANIGCYRLEWQLLNTAWVLPQSRERVYLVGSLAERCGGGIFPIREDDFDTTQTQGQARGSGERIWSANNTRTISQRYYKDGGECLIQPLFGDKDTNRSIRSGGKSSATDKHSFDLVSVQPVLTPDRLVKPLTERRTDEAKEIRKQSMKTGRDFSPRRGKELVERDDDVVGGITAALGYEQFLSVKSNTAQGYDVAAPGDSINFSQPNSKTRRGRVGKGIAQTLETQPTQGLVMIQRPRGYNNGAELDNCPSLGCSSFEHNNHIKQSTRIRRLTEIECERLQGFEDDWTAIGVNDKGEEYKVPKTARYKAMGNAVTVDIVALVGRAILRNVKKC
jgi:DNA (cytosine-5)-methyltransferase 1